jgi:thiosulfate/3-mercaptopyruvate sulfurtransferase
MSEHDPGAVTRRLASLLSADELFARLGDPDLVVLDATVVRSPQGTPSVEAGAARWEQSHIPGSRHADLVVGLSDPAARFGFTNPGPQRIAEGLAELGAGPATRLVVYDDEDRSMWATRVWWLAHSIGLTDIFVLDGGWQAWTRAGLPVESGPRAARPAPAPITPRPTEVFIGTREVLAGLAGDTCGGLLCALDPEIFSGAAGDYPRRGHIPGAANVPARSLVRQDRTFHDPGTLADLLTAYRDADPVDVYCGGGISATVVAFALANLGWPRVRVYDGSLEEWAADPALPLETGS